MCNMFVSYNQTFVMQNGRHEHTASYVVLTYGYFYCESCNTVGMNPMPPIRVLY